jgi:integrase
MADWKWDEARQAWRKELWFGGQRTKLTFKGSKKDALAHEASKRTELGKVGAIFPQTSVVGFATFCVETYKPHAKGTLRATTWAVRRYQLEPLIAHFKDAPLTKVTTAHVEAYKQAREKEVDKVTVNSELTVLSAVLSYARHLQVPCASPAIKRFPVSKRKGRAKAFTRDEVGLLLAGAREVSPDFGVLVRFLAETGCRRSEGIALPWSRVDFATGLARIWSSTDEDEAAYEVKSREREVTLNAGLVLALKAQRLRVGTSSWCFPVVTNRASRGGKTRTKGDRYGAWPKHLWARVVSEANKLRPEGAPAITGGPHRLRHTYASLFLQARPDLFALGRVLGHSHSRVTELYSHLLPDHLATTRGVVVFDEAANPTQIKTPPKTPPKGVSEALPIRRIRQ